MAPHVPEEVDVFTAPHNRMKELVNAYVEQIQKTNFMNDGDLGSLLESLLHTFAEFRSHEKIENRFIMRRLKNKLKKLSIKNQAVCNCHKDSHLIEMQILVQQGYDKIGLSLQDRSNYILQLKKSLDEFTEDFLPHMKQEEEVFQPLLLKYFSYQELCEIKRSVMSQHLLEMQNRLLGIEKSFWDSQECDSSGCESDDEEEEELNEKVSKVLDKYAQTSTHATASITDLPPEITAKIFGFLGPKDLSHSAQVCMDWSELAMDPVLWRHLYPRRWARGDWSFHPPNSLEEEEDVEGINEEEYIVIDDDADIDESMSPDEEENDKLLQLRREARLLLGLTKYVLPKVGSGVRTLDLSYCKALTNGLLQKMLRHCPNVEHLDLTQTTINDTGLKGIGKNYCCSKLHHLVLSGCANITDATLVRLAMALSQPALIDWDVPIIPEEPDNDKKRDELLRENCLCNQFKQANEKLHEVTTRVLEDASTSRSDVSKTTTVSNIGFGVFDDIMAINCVEPKTGGFCRKEQITTPQKNEVINSIQTKYGSLAKNGKPTCSSAKEQPGENLCVPYERKSATCCKVVADGAKHCDKSLALAKKHCENEEHFYEKPDLLQQNGDDEDRPPVPDVCYACCQNRIQDDPDPIEDCARFHGNPGHNKPQPPPDGTVDPQGHGGQGPGGHTKYVAADGLGKLRDPEYITPPISVPIEVLMGISTKEDFCLEEKETCDVPSTSVKARDKTAASQEEEEEVGDFVQERHPLVERTLAHLDLSGCYLVTDVGLRSLAGCGPFPRLGHLDLSGCLNVTGAGISSLVNASPCLDPQQLFYCDNILDGPFPDCASGCQNLECGMRVCCRLGC